MSLATYHKFQLTNHLDTFGGSKIMTATCQTQFTFWKVGPQEVHVDFAGGRIVSDAGLLALRAFDKHLGIVAALAGRLSDPRSPHLITHSKESLLTQEVYQILAGYPDGNDADTLRHDPLFKTLLDQPADDDSPALASSSTLNRFLYAYTRRDAHLPQEERPVLCEQQTVLNQRLIVGNDRSEERRVGKECRSRWSPY